MSSHTQPSMNPFRGGLVPVFRLIAIPVFAAVLITAVGVLSNAEAWRRNVLGASFLIYYILVCVIGVIQSGSTVESVFGEDGGESHDARLRNARHAVRVHFSLWMTGFVAILAALFVGMNKSRWDMPVPVPALQILSAVAWVLLSSVLLQLLSLYRGLALIKGGSGGAYLARGLPIYTFLVLLFPIYFLLYAGHGKSVAIPYLILFTLPTNVVLALLIVRYYRAVRSLLGPDAEFFFHADTGRSAKRVVQTFTAVALLIVVVFLDYGRYRRALWTYAAAEDHVMLFRLLRMTGVNQQSTDEHSFTPLFWAVHGGANNFAKYALDNGASLTDENEFGQTPLIVAVLVGRLSMVQLLVEHGADVNRPDSKEGQPPLVLACRDGKIDIAEFLLQKKADPLQKNNKGMTALMVAQENGHQAIVELLKRSGGR